MENQRCITFREPKCMVEVTTKEARFLQFVLTKCTKVREHKMSWVRFGDKKDLNLYHVLIGSS